MLLVVLNYLIGLTCLWKYPTLCHVLIYISTLYIVHYCISMICQCIMYTYHRREGAKKLHSVTLPDVVFVARHSFMIIFSAQFLHVDARACAHVRYSFNFLLFYSNNTHRVNRLLFCLKENFLKTHMNIP